MEVGYLDVYFHVLDGTVEEGLCPKEIRFFVSPSSFHGQPTRVDFIFTYFVLNRMLGATDQVIPVVNRVGHQIFWNGKTAAIAGGQSWNIRPTK